MSTHTRERSGHPQSGSLQIDALMALLVLGGSAVLCLHLAWQNLLGQRLQQQWLDAIDWLEGSSAALHVWPQSLIHWQQAGSLQANPDAHSCERSSCALDEWAQSLAQWGLGQLPELIPQAQSQWLTPQNLNWQAGPSHFSLAIHTWQVSWGMDTPQTLSLLVSP
ncbi:MAG: hypothetical protein RL307_1496 [Pseudomonadota bacterium]